MDRRISFRPVTSPPGLTHSPYTPMLITPTPHHVLTDPLTHRTNQRLRQLAFGKATEGYLRYLAHVPKTSRDPLNPHHPRTPRACSPATKRQWDRQLLLWRSTLHCWDHSPAPSRSCPLSLGLCTLSQGSMPPPSGRGKSLLSMGDVEPNPGPCPQQEEAHSLLDDVVRPHHDAVAPRWSCPASDPAACPGRPPDVGPRPYWPVVT